MSNDSKLITIYRSQNKADFLIIEALLNSAGIEKDLMELLKDLEDVLWQRMI